MSGPENMGKHGELLKNAIERFQSLQDELSSYGAYDSEPRAVFADLLDDTLGGKDVNVPMDGERWQLYTVSMKCGTAGRRLGGAAKRCVDIIRNAPISAASGLKSVVEWYYG